MAGCRNTLSPLPFESEALVAQLVVVEGPAMGRTFDVGAGTTVGTTSTCAVCIPDRRAQDFHARIELRGGVFYMQSLGEEESFQINGRAVREGPLQHGDMLTIGETLLLFDHDERAMARKDSVGSSSSGSSFSDLLDSSVYRRQKLYDDAKSLVRTFQIQGKDEKKLAILYQFTNEIVNIFDLRALGAKILEVLRQVFPVDRAVVLVQEDGGKRVVPVATWSARSAGGDPKASRTILREALKSRQGLITMDAMDDERFLSGQSIVDQNIHSAMCVPLIHNEEVIGVIEIDKEESHAFDEADLELMNGIALQAASAIQNVRVFSRRRRYTDNLVSLANATQRISSFLRESQLVKETMYLVCNLLGVDKCSLLLGDPLGQGTRLKLAYAVGLDKELWPEIRVESGQGLAGWVHAHTAPLLVPDPEGNLPEGLELTGRDRYQTKSCLLVPIKTRAEGGSDKERARGVLCASDKLSGHIFDADDRESLLIVANQLAIALHNSELYEKATVDVLTRVYVRRFLMQRMEELLPACQEKEIPCSLMMMDLDHFKEKNDTYGHQTGDIILREMGLLIRKSFRENDIAARYGGEEFAVLLYNTPVAIARKIGERLRETTAGNPFNRKRQPIRATISIGIAAMEPGDTPDAMIKKADDALYMAKQAGRNRVHVWGDPKE